MCKSKSGYRCIECELHATHELVGIGDAERQVVRVLDAVAESDDHRGSLGTGQDPLAADTKLADSTRTSMRSTHPSASVILYVRRCSAMSSLVRQRVGVEAPQRLGIAHHVDEVREEVELAAGVVVVDRVDELQVSLNEFPCPEYGAPL